MEEIIVTGSVTLLRHLWNKKEIKRSRTKFSEYRRRAIRASLRIGIRTVEKLAAQLRISMYHSLWKPGIC
jgi:hypothetical protein